MTHPVLPTADKHKVVIIGSGFAACRPPRNSSVPTSTSR